MLGLRSQPEVDVAAWLGCDQEKKEKRKGLLQVKTK